MSDEKKPRERVVELMRRMAKASALLGGAVGLSAAESCSAPMVCDPLPPAITCANPTHQELNYAEYFAASWTAVDGGAMAVELTIADSSIQALTFSTAGLTVTGGTLLSATVTGRQLLASIEPQSGVATVTVVVRFTCEGASDSMTLAIDLGTPRPGAPVPVRLVSP